MTTTWVRNNKTAWRKYGDEAVVITLGDQRVHQLNTTATYIWEQLEKQISETELCSRLLDEFDASEMDLKNDCCAFIKLLAENGLIVKTNMQGIIEWFHRFHAIRLLLPTLSLRFSVILIVCTVILKKLFRNQQRNSLLPNG